MAHDFFNDEKQSFEALGEAGDRHKKHNREITEKRRDFTARIDEAMVKTDPADTRGVENPRYRSREEKIECLDKILNEKGFNRRDSTEVMQLFASYRDLGAYDKMIEVYTKTDSRDFRSAPMVREQLAGAYYQRSFEEGRSPELVKKDRAMAARICDHLMYVEKNSSIAYGIAAKCLVAEGKQAEATKMYENGFKETLDPFIGLQAVHANLESGNKKRAEETAKVVYLAALRDGAEESKDFYAVSAALQAACIAGAEPEKIAHLSNRLAHCVQYEWQKDEIERNLKTIEQNGFDAAKVVQQEISGWKLKEDARKSGLIVIENLKKDDRTFGEDEKLSALHEHSYNYRGCGSDFRGVSRVGGNMEFGGQLPSHTVSRQDLELFTALIHHTPEELGIKNLEGLDPELPLDQIKEPEVFMKAADRLIRQTFMTGNFAGRGLHLEENALSKEADGKSVYDRTVAGALEESGKISDIDTLPEEEQWKEKAFVDTRTNISAIFALGMGDCRHHAQVKQIMFDMYQRKRMNDALGAMLDQVREGKTIDLENGKEAQAFYKELNTELRTTDVQVMMPIKMHQQKKVGKKWVPAKEGEEGAQDATYKPVLTGDKKYTVDESGAMHNLEDHTLCWFIRKDKEGRLESLEMRDAFYQEKHYGWGDRPVDIESEISLETRKDKDGKEYTALKIKAGTIKGDKTNTGEEIEVYQEPTSYNTGRRDREVNTSTGRDVCFVGMRMEGFDSADSFISMIKDREGMAEVLNKIEHKKRAADQTREQEKGQEKQKESNGAVAVSESAPKAPKQETQQQSSAEPQKTTLMGNLSKQQRINDAIQSSVQEGNLHI